MPDNKKHHFAPKFYLKRFSDDGKSINAYVLKSSKKVLSANLANQCYRDYFYGKEPDFEHALGLHEGEVAGLLKTIGDTNALPEKCKDRISLLLFILLQSARTELIVEELNDVTDKFFKHVFADRAKADGIDINDYKMVMQEPAKLSLQMTAENYPVLMDLDFRLLLNSTKEGFITSDNPVAFYNQLMSFRKNVPSSGYASKGLQIFFPLDDKRMLCLFDGAVYRAPGNMGDTLSIMDVRDVYELNTVLACSASSVLYFRDKDQDIDALCKKASPFFRTTLSNFDAYPQEAPPGGKRELLMTSRPEISTNMALSFLSVRRSARKWREEFRRIRLQPAVVVRNEQLLRDHREFLEAVKDGAYHHMQFREFMRARYGG
jgi:hypothetical protein